MAEVSILMNGYNSEKYLKETLDSVYTQSFENWEIIFIDNCSTDKTSQIAKSYDERVKYYKTEKNIPLGAARNWGLQYCKAPFLAFLDTDDLWLPNKLELQLELMKKNQELKMIYGGVIYINKDSNHIGEFIPSPKEGNVFPAQLNRYEVNMQSVMIRNNIPVSFNTSMQFSPDFDLFMKVCSEHNVGVISEAIVKYRKLENSLSSKKIDRWWIETKATLDAIFEKYPSLKHKYPKEVQRAYAKVSYYKACYLMSIDKKAEAREILFQIRNIDVRYTFLYLALFFPKALWQLIHVLKNR